MKNSYANLMSPPTDQREPLDERQVQNNAGGFVYAVDNWKRLERFLILGSDGGTYYQKARALTRENAKVVEECWAENPGLTAKTIIDISVAGRAPKNDAAIFAVALGTLSTNDLARIFAFECVQKVCRTGTHLLQFVSTCKQLGRGFGRGMKRAIGAWYKDMPLEKLAYQVVKYRNRAGLTHENVLDMARPKSDEVARNAVFAWIVGKLDTSTPLIQSLTSQPGRAPVEVPARFFPAVIIAHERAMKLEPEHKAELLGIIRENKDLPWEALPTWANADPDIQGALLPGMGLTAIVRNLGNFTRIGLLTPLSTAEDLIVNRLSIEDEIKRSRIHPMQILIALKIYALGRGMAHAGKTPHTWVPNQRVCHALNDAFYMAFQNVVPTGKRHFVAIDVSGSMSSAISAGSPISCCEASSAMAMMTARTEPRSFIGRFNHGIEPVTFGPNSRMEDVLRQTNSINMGGTDCALPMIYAMQNNIEADVFVVLTDNETHSCRTGHPMEALREYRRKTGIPAKLVVVAMTSTGFTVGDPNDAGCLDVVGFDAATPAVMAEFVRG